MLAAPLHDDLMHIHRETLRAPRVASRHISALARDQYPMPVARPPESVVLTHTKAAVL